MKIRQTGLKIERRTISLSPETLEIAQQNAIRYYGGNLSAYLAALIMQFKKCEKCKAHSTENQKKH